MARRDEDDGGTVQPFTPTPASFARRQADLLDPDWGQGRKHPPRYAYKGTSGYIAAYQSINGNLGLSKPGFVNYMGITL